MESELNELIQELATLEKEGYKIRDEKKTLDESIQKRKKENQDSIDEITVKIQQLRNQLGSDIVLTQEKECNLRKELVAVDEILNRVTNDESDVTLRFEVPSPDTEPYSIHINIRIEYEPIFHIVIKTKCPIVSRIVRETLIQYNNMRSSDELSPEEQCKFDMNIRREWYQSRHGETHINFNHKPEPVIEDE